MNLLCPTTLLKLLIVWAILWGCRDLYRYLAKKNTEKLAEEDYKKFKMKYDIIKIGESYDNISLLLGDSDMVFASDVSEPEKITTKCPNCGADITEENPEKCPYCQTKLVKFKLVKEIRVWNLVPSGDKFIKLTFLNNNLIQKEMR